MQLSKKVKIFCGVFSPFLKFASNFRHFEKRDDCQSLCISEFADCKRHV